MIEELRIRSLGVIDEASPADESFAAGLLEYPQYTKPAEYRGLAVPAAAVRGDAGRDLDAAIEGSGFFVVKTPVQVKSYASIL